MKVWSSRNPSLTNCANYLARLNNLTFSGSGTHNLMRLAHHPKTRRASSLHVPDLQVDDFYLTQIPTQHMMSLKRHEISAHNGNRESNKVGGPNSITYLNQTLIFEWWWFSADLRTDIKRHMFQRDWNMCSKFVNHSKLNIHYDWWGGGIGFLKAHSQWTLITRNNL